MSWFCESRRHRLARYGVKTSRKNKRYGNPLFIKAQKSEYGTYEPINLDYIDSLAYSTIKRMNEMGIKTKASCEGHGRDEGEEDMYIPRFHKYSTPYIAFETDDDVEKALGEVGWNLVKFKEPKEYIKIRTLDTEKLFSKKVPDELRKDIIEHGVEKYDSETLKNMGLTSKMKIKNPYHDDDWMRVRGAYWEKKLRSKDDIKSVWDATEQKLKTIN